MRDLIERLEKATGAHRELDARVWCWAKDVEFIKISERNDVYGDICLPHEHGHGWPNTMGAGWLVFRYAEQPENGNQTQCFRSFPFYTASIDAALALAEEVLPGWAWSVGNKLYGGQAYLMRAPGGEMIAGSGANPALAILIATLKAKEAQ